MRHARGLHARGEPPRGRRGWAHRNRRRRRTIRQRWARQSDGCVNIRPTRAAWERRAARASSSALRGIASCSNASRSMTAPAARACAQLHERHAWHAPSDHLRVPAGRGRRCRAHPRRRVRPCGCRRQRARVVPAGRARPTAANLASRCTCCRIDSGRCHSAHCNAAWRTGPSPRRIFVQWVPHGYGRRSLNLAVLRVGAAAGPGARRPGRGDGARGVPRVRCVARAAERRGAGCTASCWQPCSPPRACVWLATPSFEPYVRPYGLGRPLGYRWLPLPSPLARTADHELVARVGRRWPSPVVGSLRHVQPARDRRARTGHRAGARGAARCHLAADRPRWGALRRRPRTPRAAGGRSARGDRH